MRYTATIFMLFLCLSSSLAAPSEKPTPVTVVQVVAQPLSQELPLTGTAEPLRESAISSRVSGVVSKVLVTEGDWVDAGETLLMLDPVIAELEVASARARVDEAIARHEDAIRQKNEFQSLIGQKAVATTSVASAEADEEAARATVARQRAELLRLEELLSRHTLKAPFTGIVGEKHVEVGQWVDADSAVVKLVALDRIRIRAALPQRYYGRIDTDAKARILFDALQGEVFFSKPSALVAVGNQSTRSFPVLFDLENDQNRIAPGMSARVFVELAGSQTQALLIPRDAVVLKADGSRIVWRLAEDNGDTKVKPVQLLVGRAQGDLVEVVESSLKAGDNIVLLGNENLRPGQAVEPRQSE